MTADWLVPAALATLVGLALLAVLALWRARSRDRAELAEARAEAAELRARVDALAHRVAPARHEPEEFVITRMGGVETGAERLPRPPEGPERIDGRLFADLVLRETVVKAAALTHGVRRALAPDVRNRIRFEMRREMKRSRKARRDELRDLRREMHARQRARRTTEGAA